VAITVEHGNHAWILTGFTATADPATTSHFTVTSVNVVGPLWGLQSTSYGYDMRPDRRLTVSQLRGFFTPWHYARVKMAWEGDWVSVQPVAATAKPVPKPTKVAAATARPEVTPTTVATPTPTATATSSPSPNPSRKSSLAPNPTIADVAALVGPIASTPPSTQLADSSVASVAVGVIVLVAAAVVLLGGLALRRRPSS
jgi:hypothetical protein